MKLDSFTAAYINTALWASTGDDDTPLDRNYGPGDIGPESIARMAEDCARFQKENADLLTAAYCHDGYTEPFNRLRHECENGQIDALAGHDFWLTRNRHGTGFWDRDLGDIGDKLTEAAHAFGESSLYEGDDGQIYLY